MVIFTSIMHAIGYAALAMPLGILAAHYNLFTFGIIHSVALLLIAITAWLSKKRFDIIISVFLIAFFLGVLLYQEQRKTYQQRCAWYQTNTLDVLATVNDIAKKSTKTCLWLTIHKTRYNINQPWQPAHDAVLLLSSKMPTIDIGDNVYIEALTCVPSGNDIITKNGLVGTAFFAKTIAITQRPSYSLLRWVAHKRRELWHSLQIKLSPATFHLFSTIFLGKTDNDTLQEQLRTHFIRWGLAHYLARSGIHLIMILLLLNTLLRIIIFSYRLRALLITLICLAYALLSWVSIPFIRALFAICMYQGCHILKVPIDSLHILHLTLITCLVLNPASLFFLDFQLTFALTYTLIIATRNR